MLAFENKITLEEYMQLPIGAPYQYINGCLIDWPSRTLLHQSVLGNICHYIGNYSEQTRNNGWFMIGPIEVVLDNQNSFQPDFAYVSSERAEIVKDYIYGAPDMVIEVLWEKNAYYDLRQKKDKYEKYGVKEYIIFDPIIQDAQLYTLKNNIYHLHQLAGRQEILNSVLLPGLSFKLEKVFRGI